MIRFIKQFLISFTLYCSLILGAWLAGTTVSSDAFILGIVLCALLIAFVEYFTRNK